MIKKYALLFFIPLLSCSCLPKWSYTAYKRAAEIQLEYDTCVVYQVCILKRNTRYWSDVEQKTLYAQQSVDSIKSLTQNSFKHIKKHELLQYLDEVDEIDQT